MNPTAPGYLAVVPVKPPRQGKSRLSVLPEDQRVALARAMALDTVAAVRACPEVRAVLAVTDDFRFARELEGTGCDVLPDGVSGDLNGTLAQAAHEAVRRRPGHGLVVVCADLPALRPAELAAALRAVPAPAPGFVADEVGTGTTVYAVRDPAGFAPRFGPGSAAAHAAGGAVALDGPWPSLRLDLDEVGDLGRALTLGVGPLTAAAAGR